MSEIVFSPEFSKWTEWGKGTCSQINITEVIT